MFEIQGHRQGPQTQYAIITNECRVLDEEEGKRPWFWDKVSGQGVAPPATVNFTPRARGRPLGLPVPSILPRNLA